MFLYCGPLVAAAFIASQCAGRLGDDGYSCSQERCHALAAKQAAPDDIVSSKQLQKKPTALQKEKMQYLKSALSLNNKKLEIMLAKRPYLLSPSLNGMERRLQFLQARLSLNKKQLSKMVQRLPALLQYGTDKNIEAKLQYLQKRLMLEEKELIKFVRTQPPVFSQGIETLERKLVFIQSRLLLDDKELSRLVKRFSSVLSVKPETLNQKLEYFQKRLSMDDEQLREFSIKYPKFLGHNIESNLEPKIAFFESLIGINEAKAMLIAYPSILTYSMEKRIKPRLAEVQEAGLPIEAAALVRIAMYTEEKWTASVVYQTKQLLLSKGELW